MFYLLRLALERINKRIGFRVKKDIKIIKQLIYTQSGFDLV